LGVCTLNRSGEGEKMKIKILTCILSIGLLSFLVTGGTLAYFTDEVDLSERANFNFSTVQIDVEEITGEKMTIDLANQDSSEKAVWRITNRGSEGVRLRVQVRETVNIAENLMHKSDMSETEMSEMSSTESTALQETDLATETATAPDTNIESILPGVELHVSDSWEKEDDDYYYYNGILTPNEKVEFAVDLEVFGNWNGNGNYELTIEALQASNTEHKNWPELR
jgi:predicted ribosomally synthesized peptide with SipW-like signal peptide